MYDVESEETFIIEDGCVTSRAGHVESTEALPGEHHPQRQRGLVVHKEMEAEAVEVQH